MPRPQSERAAWVFVRDHAKMIERDRSLPRVTRQHAELIANTAAEMLEQVGRGLHANPALVVYGNPPKGGELMSRRVYAVEYKHADDAEDYRHDCARGVSMYALGDGAILLQRPDRKPLSREFDV